MQRIKTITSYTGLARWLAETSTEPIAWLARGQVDEIPSPYYASPTVSIHDWNGRAVIYFETRHRHYEVFEVPAELLRFKSDEEAADLHLLFCRAAARH